MPTEIITNEMPKEAFIQYGNLLSDVLPGDREIMPHTFSPAFKVKMKKLFRKVSRRDRRRKFLRLLIGK